MQAGSPNPYLRVEPPALPIRDIAAFRPNFLEWAVPTKDVRV